jgi:hypothetical protein
MAMKKPKKTLRNPYTIPAMKRKSGKMRPKKDKRLNGKNEHQELLKENEDVKND